MRGKDEKKNQSKGRGRKKDVREEGKRGRAKKEEKKGNTVMKVKGQIGRKVNGDNIQR